MELAKVSTDGKVTASGTGIAVLIAIVAIVPAGVTAAVDYVVKPSTVVLETSKLDLERRKAAAALYQAALADPDPSKRQLLLRFLVKTHVLEDDGTIGNMPLNEIPQWPPTAPTSGP